MDDDAELVELVPFDFDRDITDVLAIWHEAGWWDGAERQEQQIRAFFRANDRRSIVGRVRGRGESAVHGSLGSLRFRTTEVPLGAVTAATTSRVARRLGLASRLTARLLAGLAEDGAAVAMLGMFEQGFYDRLGFGTGPYEHFVFVYPGAFRVPAPYRTPLRLSLDDDLSDIHRAFVRRHRGHGGVVLGDERLTAAGLQIDDEVRIFGYRTGGELTHFMVVATDGEHGPDKIIQWAYQTPAQCLELLRLAQEWGDQVDLVRFTEPVWMQAQDLMVDPGTEGRRTRGGSAAVRIVADAWWQIRILDLGVCLGALGPPAGGRLEFVLELDDPVSRYLEPSGGVGSWTGIGGRWHVSLGSDGTGVEPARDQTGPVLSTSVGALSRWWLGVLPASSLTAMGMMAGPDDLIAALDDLTAGLPRPQPGWDF